MKKLVLLIVLCSCFASFGQNQKFKVQKTDKEWKAQLSKEEYEVLRNKGTERAFTGKYWNTFDKGKYVCAACGQVIFNSDSKFHSDCGWPSFDKAIKGSVIYKTDTSLGMVRTEVMCANCGSHLGHVFDDGPANTTGKRFCTNSVSIKFIPAKNEISRK
ncbi:peptide-methionine (R)-S-oxide reductase MsrB [Flavobacterium supellecticarium]|uniref:peptide-methionine (R)-S-oxide reductase n=1 Tax=Flavobacterium supellecticarium TaxID=2565924 RepID=A0A4S4A2L6_9FLAO|nr:peptide-methionine (R)-S-oxide reductase MsrB [Flavobacterium supellecticarium]THF52637.1 peptide-methionine (R)-S-oxide reductase MsrB [Flavobacterium supellecticarium]